MWPQFILLAMVFMCIGINCAKNGESTTYDGLGTVINRLVVLGLLYWGGFFDCFLTP
jgi:hypothetical protein